VIITTIIVVILAIGIAVWLLMPQQPAPVTPTTVKPTTTQPATTPAQTTTVQTTPLPSPSAKCPDEIVIGTAMPISGRYAAEGQYSLWGALAVVNWINDRGGLDCGGKKVRLVYRDSESKLELTQKYTEELITRDKVHFLLSPYGSDLALGVSSIAEKYGVLMRWWGPLLTAYSNRGLSTS